MGLVRHLSVRVPWHDRVWDGHVCNAPLENSSCLALKLIAENRKDHVEEGIASEAFDKLQRENLPPCLRASASFLEFSCAHVRKRDGLLHMEQGSHAHPAPDYACAGLGVHWFIPYRWMLKEGGFKIAEDLELDAHSGREPTTPAWLNRTSWIQGFSNQQVLLKTFADPLTEEKSLVLFYATRTPLVRR